MEGEVGKRGGGGKGCAEGGGGGWERVYGLGRGYTGGGRARSRSPDRVPHSGMRGRGGVSGTHVQRPNLRPPPPRRKRTIFSSRENENYHRGPHQAVAEAPRAGGGGLFGALASPSRPTRSPTSENFSSGKK